MFLCQNAFLVAVLILASVVQSSVPGPIHGISNEAAFNPEPFEKTEFSTSSSNHSRDLSKVEVTPRVYSRALGPAPPGYIAFKFLHRGPDYALLPIRVGAIALHAFYISISCSASTVWPQTKSPESIFTLSHGPLQLTMSGLGTVVPWDFVEDWAMKAAESVAKGWTDTFDALYEVEGTGMSVWVSLRLLEG